MTIGYHGSCVNCVRSLMLLLWWSMSLTRLSSMQSRRLSGLFQPRLYRIRWSDDQDKKYLDPTSSTKPWDCMGIAWGFHVLNLDQLESAGSSNSRIGLYCCTEWPSRQGWKLSLQVFQKTKRLQPQINPPHRVSPRSAFRLWPKTSESSMSN